ncbi:MAG: FHA domain-containing protein, partial [Polyangiales bacterium]
MARLILATAEGTQTVELRPHNTLGRHPNNSIQLLDKIVSKEHCHIELRNGDWVLKDLGSLNGTYINAERVQGEKGLRHGDEIALGATRARFDDGSTQMPSRGMAPIGTPPPQAAVPAAGYQPGGSPTGAGFPNPNLPQPGGSPQRLGATPSPQPQ